MDVVYKNTITLKYTESQDKIGSYLHDALCSAAYMLTQILMPLAEIEEEIEILFDEISEKGLFDENTPHANWFINLHENQLTIEVSHGDDVDELVQAMHN